MHRVTAYWRLRRVREGRELRWLSVFPKEHGTRQGRRTAAPGGAGATVYNRTGIFTLAPGVPISHVLHHGRPEDRNHKRDREMTRDDFVWSVLQLARDLGYPVKTNRDGLFQIDFGHKKLHEGHLRR